MSKLSKEYVKHIEASELCQQEYARNIPKAKMQSVIHMYGRKCGNIVRVQTCELFVNLKATAINVGHCISVQSLFGQTKENSPLNQTKANLYAVSLD